MSDILQQILSTKREEVAQGKALISEAAWLNKATQLPPPRGFYQALHARVQQGQAAVIAEIKRASPSKGVLRTPFDPIAIAQSYAQHGAACLSVLTDVQYFQGAPHYLDMARQACNLPALRKDFMVDTYQVVQARGLGADAILLIVAALPLPALLELEACALELGMDVLVEVHDAAEMELALQLKTPLIGVNNRNLRTFATSLQTTLDLQPMVGPSHLLVTESGIATQADVAHMRRSGVHAFLVGEAFMRAPNPGEALAGMFGG